MSARALGESWETRTPSRAGEGPIIQGRTRIPDQSGSLEDKGRRGLPLEENNH